MITPGWHLRPPTENPAHAPVMHVLEAKMLSKNAEK